MSASRPRAHARACEARLWTGPVGHLLGGTLDIVEAIVRHALAPRLRSLRPRRRVRVGARGPRW